MKRTRIIFFILLTFLWLGVIFSFSLQPADLSGSMSRGITRKLLEFFMTWFSDKPVTITQEQMEVFHMVIRKCAHFTEFMILGILSAVTLVQMNLRYRGLIGIIFCVLSAAADEILQLFVDGRAGQVMDVLIDSTGAAAGVGVVFLICYKFY